MSDTNIAGTILIKEDTCLPANLPIESEPFLPGWRVVKRVDRSTLARNIEGVNWNFFYLAGEIRTTALGRNQLGTLRRAVKCVLAKQEGQKFNSLEITEVVSNRFLGIPFINITAHSRHIQQSIGLATAKDSAPRIPVAPPNKEMTTKQFTALIPSS